MLDADTRQFEYFAVDLRAGDTLVMLGEVSSGHLSAALQTASGDAIHDATFFEESIEDEFVIAVTGTYSIELSTDNNGYRYTFTVDTK